MSGYNTRAFDLERLLHYSFFTDQGLTIHDRGMGALFERLPVSQRICRIYVHDKRTASDITRALDALFSDIGLDDATNM